VKRLIYLIVIIAIIITGLFIIRPPHTTPYLGDVDGLGSAEDENARANYEWMMLNDPATGKIPAHIHQRELAFAADLPNDSYLSMSRITSAGWQSRGPWNVGGRTRAFAIDVSNEANFVAGTTSGGMFRSTNQGLTWTETTPANQYQSVTCLAQDTRTGHTNTWYYGTGEGTGASASGDGAYYLGNGIYKSTDGGITWNILPSTTTSKLTVFDIWADIIWNIVTYPADTVHDVVFAAAYGGIYKSSDGGTTWAAVIAGAGSNNYFSDVAVSKTGIVYATLSSEGTPKGLFRSADGITFTNITPPSFPASYKRLKIGISPSNENQVYFLGNTPGYGQPDTNFQGTVDYNSLWRYTYISGDGSGAGGSWQDLSANIPNTGGFFDRYDCQTSYDIVVKVKPDDTNTVFIGGTDIFRSTSGFKDNTHTTFVGGYQKGAALPVVLQYANHHPDQHELAFFPSDPKKMVSTNDGGVFVTYDNTAPAVTWTSLNNGYIATQFYSCAVDHASTNDIVIGGAQDNGSWYTNSASLTTPWVTPRGGDGSFCAIADGGSAYYFSIQNGRIMRAKLNASGGVDSFARIDPIGAAGYIFINPFVIDPNNNNIMYMAGGLQLWRNNNLAGIPYAGNWDSITTNWAAPATFALPYTITAISACKTPVNRVYVGTSARKVYKIDNANSASPVKTDITNSLFPFVGSGSSSAYVSCIAVDPTNGDNIMVVFSNYGLNSLFYSSDAGVTWKKIGGNLEQNNLTGAGDGPSCRWASIVPVTGGTAYYVGTSVGLFATTALNDTFTVWTQQGTNTIGASIVDMIDYRSTDGLIVIATHSHGIFSRHIADINDVAVNQVVANTVTDFTNYPNPFSNTTTIRFNIKDKQKVLLQVFDIRGALVSTIANEEMYAGEKRYTFSANNLAAGIYYCTLKTNTSTQTRPMVITK